MHVLEVLLYEGCLGTQLTFLPACHFLLTINVDCFMCSSVVFSSLYVCFFMCILSDVCICAKIYLIWI
jgi:hypothetical protein